MKDVQTCHFSNSNFHLKSIFYFIFVVSNETNDFCHGSIYKMYISRILCTLYEVSDSHVLVLQTSVSMKYFESHSDVPKISS